MSKISIKNKSKHKRRNKNKKVMDNSANQELYIFVPAVSITFETDTADADDDKEHQALSLFVAVFGIHGLIKNWSANLDIEGGINLEMAYYNQHLDVWEPIIEPLEMTDRYKPWEISLHIKTIHETEDDDHGLPPPKMAIAIVSSDIMQLTLTKTYLEMLYKFKKDVTKKANAPSAISRPIKKFSAPYVFNNVLPYPVSVITKDRTVTLRGGEFVELSGAATVDVKVVANVALHCTIDIAKTKLTELTNHKFTGVNQDNSIMEMDLGIRATTARGTTRLSLYCPFWMVNKTGFTLSYKTSSSKFGWCCCTSDANQVRTIAAEGAHTPAVQPADTKDPLMLTFNGKNFFRKKKAYLKINDSEWSKLFSVDTVGSAGRIVCKIAGGGQMEISLTIQLSYSGLTKICTFTPFYLIENSCSINIEVRQSSSNQWLTIPASKVVPFWPKQMKKHMLLYVRYSGTKEESLPFPFTESFEAFVPITNQYAGVDVCCHISEGSVVIEIEDFQDGMAPALLVNATENFKVSYAQDRVESWKFLAPGTCVLFKWESMIVKRVLTWSCGTSTLAKDNLFKDGTGQFTSTDKKGAKGYWVSFLDSRQRVLLFTEDVAVALAAQAIETERIDQQVTFSFHGVGISLVDNIRCVEVAYISATRVVHSDLPDGKIFLCSSGLMWEYQKKHFKAMPLKESRELEEAFILYTNEKLSGKKIKSRQTYKNNIEADFEIMHQYKPFDRVVRRSFEPGLWMQYRTSAHKQQLHMKLNHIQVDNQLPNCVFPIVFVPVPPPKSVVAELVPKPFAELTYVARKAEYSTVPQVKYFKILVQEVALKVDQGFINSLLSYYGSEEYTLYTPELFQKDRELTQHDLAWYASVTTSTEQKAFYDNLHFSPIKLHFSYSQGGVSSTSKQVHVQSEIFNLFMKSFGVTLTEVQDVVFKLAYFERQGVFLNRPQLTTAYTSHYINQAIKQAYVLIFGLDIIGNPFGLIRDLSTGVETFFYEPFQGAIQGSEEFAEGLTLGVKSLFGHAVGGAAGAVSRITGTLGKGLAALTLDKDFQNKRQQVLSQKPTTLHEGVMQSGKGLFMGFYDGITGVVTKPIEGAKEEGVAGFFKGVGKGAVGLVVRPASGIVDFTSSSLESVKRLAGVLYDVKKIRSPRYIRPDRVIRPFNSMEADGNQMLQIAGKGKFSKTDNFKAFLQLTDDKLFFLLVTNKRIMMISKNDLFGNLEIDWTFAWQELLEAPTVVDKGLMLRLKKPKIKFLKLFGSSSGGKLVHTSIQTAQWIVEKSTEAYNEAMNTAINQT